MTFAPRWEFDPHPFLRGGSVAIVSVSVMHIIQAMLWIWSPAAAHASNMRAFLILLETVGVHSRAGSVILVTMAVSAIVGATMRLGWGRIATFLPQHFILGVMTFGGLYASYLGHYLDGTVMEWEHILTDQMPLAALFIVHSSAIIRRARDPNG